MDNYMELYNELGSRLLATMDRLGRLDEGLRRKKNSELKTGGNSGGFSAKVAERRRIAETEINACIKAINVIRPLAEYETRIKELESKEKELESLIKEFEARKDDR